MKKNKYPGITYFGILFIAGSLVWFFGYFSKYAYYQRIFASLPEKAILMRYSFSMLLRIASIICGTGILLRKDIFRRAALFLSVFNIITVYWKHPKQAISSIIEQNFSMLDLSKVSIVELLSVSANIALIVIYCIEIIFAGWFIYYFTRAKVKDQFK